MVFLRTFSDTDLSSIRKSIFSFSAIYAFFAFSDGFQIKSNDLVELLSEEPLTIASPHILYLLSVPLTYLTFRLVSVAISDWYANDKFSSEYSDEDQLFEAGEFIKSIDGISEEIASFSRHFDLLSVQLEAVRDLDGYGLKQVSRTLFALHPLLDELVRKRTESSSDDAVGHTADALLKMSRGVKSSEASIDLLLSALASPIGDMKHISTKLEQFESDKFPGEIDKFLSLLRSNNLRSRNWKRTSFFLLETSVPLVLGATCVAHTTWFFFC